MAQFQVSWGSISAGAVRRRSRDDPRFRLQPAKRRTLGLRIQQRPRRTTGALLIISRLIRTSVGNLYPVSRQQPSPEKRWCGRSESNRHSSRNRILSPARLPVPPRPHTPIGPYPAPGRWFRPTEPDLLQEAAKLKPQIAARWHSLYHADAPAIGIIQHRTAGTTHLLPPRPTIRGKT